MTVQTSLEERIKIVTLAEKGEQVWRISRHMGWRPSTIRKWRKRGQRQGREGLVSRMGRPKRGALSSYSRELRTTIRHWREEHPGWGANTLQAELARHPAFRGQKLPGQSSLCRFLHEQGLVHLYEKHVPLPVCEHQSSPNPHDVWQMDARGYQYVPDVDVITLINLNDVHSHVRLLSYPCLLGQKRADRHANTADYQTALRLAFTTWGMPTVLQVDHESIFYDNKSQSPFPTLLHLWLQALGIQLTFSRVHRPTDQAMTERSHQLWAKQVLEGQTFADWQSLYTALQKRRDFLNTQLPCHACQRQPPLLAHPQAIHSPHGYRPEYEREMLDLQRVDNYLATGRWFRRVSHNGTISLGGIAYYVGLQWHRHQVEIRFDAAQRQFLCHDEAGCLVQKISWKLNLLEMFLGEVEPIAHLPAFQLHLPFSWSEIRQHHFWCLVSDVTL